MIVVGGSGPVGTRTRFLSLASPAPDGAEPQLDFFQQSGGMKWPDLRNQETPVSSQCVHIAIIWYLSLRALTDALGDVIWLFQTNWKWPDPGS